MCVCVCVCVYASVSERESERERECLIEGEREREREKQAGSIWHWFLTQLQINLILWHLITLPIIDNQNSVMGYTYTHADI